MLAITPPTHERPDRPRVHDTCATPDASVVVDADEIDPHEDPTVQPTVSPATGFELASVTRTTSGFASGSPAMPDCPLPLMIVSCAAVPVIAVAVTVAETPPLLMVAVCVPAVPPNVQREAARPAASVVADAGAKDPPSDAEKVIPASLTEFPKRSVA